MKLSAKQALAESMNTLNITEMQVCTRKEFTIVEFCQDYLKLSVNDTIAVSRQLVDKMPMVYVEEAFNYKDAFKQVVGTPAAYIGNKIRDTSRNLVGNGTPGRTAEDPRAPRRGTGTFQGVQNFFNTKGSIAQNSPMLKVEDPDKNVVNFMAYPDLSLSRPGHKEVFDKIKQDLAAKGLQVSQLMVGDREAAIRGGKYTTINMPDDNKKETVDKALKQLRAVIDKNDAALGKYKFISPKEFEGIQKEVTDAVGTATATLAGAAETPAPVPTEATTPAANTKWNDPNFVPKNVPDQSASPVNAALQNRYGNAAANAATTSAPTPSGNTSVFNALNKQYSNINQYRSGGPIQNGVALGNQPATKPTTPVAAIAPIEPTEQDTIEKLTADRAKLEDDANKNLITGAEYQDRLRSLADRSVAIRSANPTTPPAPEPAAEPIAPEAPAIEAPPETVAEPTTPAPASSPAAPPAPATRRGPKILTADEVAQLTKKYNAGKKVLDAYKPKLAAATSQREYDSLIAARDNERDKAEAAYASSPAAPPASTTTNTEIPPAPVALPTTPAPAPIQKGMSSEQVAKIARKSATKNQIMTDYQTKLDSAKSQEEYKSLEAARNSELEAAAGPETAKEALEQYYTAADKLDYNSPDYAEKITALLAELDKNNSRFTPDEVKAAKLKESVNELVFKARLIMEAKKRKS